MFWTKEKELGNKPGTVELTASWYSFWYPSWLSTRSGSKLRPQKVEIQKIILTTSSSNLQINASQGYHETCLELTKLLVCDLLVNSFWLKSCWWKCFFQRYFWNIFACKFFDWAKLCYPIPLVSWWTSSTSGTWFQIPLAYLQFLQNFPFSRIFSLQLLSIL